MTGKIVAFFNAVARQEKLAIIYFPFLANSESINS